MNKRYFLKYIKLTTILFILIGFKSFAFPTGIKNITPAIIFNSEFKNNKIKGTDTIIISGTVKDKAGNALENITVRFDTTNVALTGIDGKFRFELKSIVPTSHNIYFSADEFVKVVRSYYPAMGSASYDIILRKQFNEEKQTANEPAPEVAHNSTLLEKASVIKKENSPIAATITPAILDLPSILFKPDATALSAEDKAFLDVVSEKLKANPVVNLDIEAYTFQNPNSELIAQKRMKNIIKYLVEKKGINAARFNKKFIPNGGDENTIDLVNSQQQ